jgi:hypothetical protein
VGSSAKQDNEKLQIRSVFVVCSWKHDDVLLRSPVLPHVLPYSYCPLVLHTSVHTHPARSLLISSLLFRLLLVNSKHSCKQHKPGAAGGFAAGLYYAEQQQPNCTTVSLLFCNPLRSLTPSHLCLLQTLSPLPCKQHKPGAAGGFVAGL